MRRPACVLLTVAVVAGSACELPALLRENTQTVRASTAGIALALSFAGFALAMISGWLGGELVNRLGVGVDDGANLDAPSSLSGRRAGPGMTQSPKRA